MSDWVDGVAGSEGDFEGLYREHLAAIIRYAFRRAGSEDAVDVVAETFAVAWRKFDDAPDGPEALPWLYAISRNVLANQRRGQLRRHGLNARLRSEWSPCSNTAIELTPQLLAVERALGQLSEIDREVLQLAGFEELSSPEIALVLDVSPAVVRNRLSRARTRLRNLLATHSEREGEEAS